MTNRQFHLTENQIKELKRYEQLNKRVDVAKRLQAIRLYGTGRATSDILEIVGCSETSLRDWATLYKRAGISSLLDHHSVSAQNARKLTQEQETDLKERLHYYEPRQVLDSRDGSGQFWTVDDVKTVVSLWYGVSYKERKSYQTLLHRCGFSYQRSEQVYKSRPSVQDVADFEAELEKKRRTSS